MSFVLLRGEHSFCSSSFSFSFRSIVRCFVSLISPIKMFTLDPMRWIHCRCVHIYAYKELFHFCLNNIIAYAINFIIGSSWQYNSLLPAYSQTHTRIVYSIILDMHTCMHHSTTLPAYWIVVQKVCGVHALFLSSFSSDRNRNVRRTHGVVYRMGKEKKCGRVQGASEMRWSYWLCVSINFDASRDTANQISFCYIEIYTTIYLFGLFDVYI